MKGNKILSIITIFSFIGLLVCYPRLPEEVPIHWNINWEVDGWGNKSLLLMLGILPFALNIIYTYLPNLDPKKANYIRYRKAYELTRYIVVVFLLIINWMTVLVALNYKVNLKVILPLLFGILFLVTGNYMPTVTNNFFFGIKNPWTLSNDIVWKKTHRVGGYIFILYSLLFFLMAFVQYVYYYYFIIAIILIGVMGINIYSYCIYRKIEKNKDN